MISIMRLKRPSLEGTESLRFGSFFRRLAMPGAVALAIAAAQVVPGSFQGAWAQDPSSGREVQALIDRIDRLQRELTTLQREVYRGGARASGGEASGPPPSQGAGALGAPGEPNLAAAMQVRLDEIETQMRGFTGQLEELNHAVDTLRKRVDQLSSDMDYRLKALESRGAAAPQIHGALPGAAQSEGSPGAPSQAAPGQPGVLGTIPRGALEGGQGDPGAAPPQGEVAKVPPQEGPVLPEGTPEARYKFATGLLFQSDFEGAERAFFEFLAAHPDHELAGNAQYWLGETHYVRGDFRTAAGIFAEGYQKYPKSDKSADNLLKLGLSLAAIDKKDSACATFDRLLREFPEAHSSVKSRAEAKSEALRCR